MKKTVSINISGIIFHIDDDAYERLNRYLNSIKRHFSKMDGRDEIVTDIESRIAELLQEKIIDTKQVISIEDIDQVISMMGEPAEMDEDSDSESRKSQKAYVYNRAKRLYRDPDGKMIAGISSGLAAYFNIDPVWFRVLFIVSLFFGGAGLIAYIILWIIVPEAITTAEKLEMRGEPVNISNIERSFRDEVDSMKGKLNNFADGARETFKKKSTGSRTFFDNLIDFLTTFLRVIFRVLVVIVGVFLILSGLSFITFFVGGTLGFSNFSFFDNGELISFSLTTFLDMIFSSRILGVLSIVSAALFIGIPLLSLIYLGSRLLFGKRMRIPYFGITAFSFWLVGIVLALIVAANTGLDFRHSSRVNKVYQIQIPENKVLYFDAETDAEFLHNQSYTELFDGHWKAMFKGSDYYIYAIPDVDFRRSNNNTSSVTVYSYAKGSSRSEAEARARSLIYPVSFTDSSFVISTYYQFPPKEKIRNQEVHLTIEIPEGQIVHFSKNMEEFFDNNPSYQYRRKGFEGRTWIMTYSGLKPYKEGMENEKHYDPEDESLLHPELTRSLSMIAFPLIGL